MWDEKEKFLISLGFHLGLKAPALAGHKVDFTQVGNAVIFVDSIVNPTTELEKELLAAICEAHKNVYMAYQKLKHEKVKNES